MTTEASVKYSIENEQKPPIANNDEFQDDNDEDEEDTKALVPGFAHAILKPNPAAVNRNRREMPASRRVYPENSHSMNSSHHKKTIAQGLLDIALLSSNANQLRYVLDYKDRNHYYYISLSLISISLILQIFVAVALVFRSRYNTNNEHEQMSADRISNGIIMGILFITIINVITGALGIVPTA